MSVLRGEMVLYFVVLLLLLFFYCSLRERKSEYFWFTRFGKVSQYLYVFLFRVYVCMCIHFLI